MFFIKEKTEKIDMYTELNLFYDVIISWCVDQDFLIDENGIYRLNTDKEDDHKYIIMTIAKWDLKSVIVKTHLSKFIEEVLNQFDTMSKIIDLNIFIENNISRSFLLNLKEKHKLTLTENLDVFYNKYKSYEVITVKEIFKRYPWIWLFWYIQYIFRGTVNYNRK